MKEGVHDRIDPFLKWPGGKRWLLRSHRQLFPEIRGRYFEPFLGSAAAFFSLIPKLATLSDINSDLIHVFITIRDHPLKVFNALRRHHSNHCEEYYYDLRGQHARTNIEKAARFLYLNRTCWNGLYRVNTRGKFNVPIGTKTNVILPTDDFRMLAEILKRATIKCSDFELIIDRANKGDFVFVDPPYTVKHSQNGFLKYNERLFSWQDQLRLRDCLLRAKTRGVTALMTNAAHKSVIDLYSDIGRVYHLGRHSVLSGEAVHRGPVEEVAIRIG